MRNNWTKTGVISPGGTVFNIAGAGPTWLGTQAGLFYQHESEGWQPLTQEQPLGQISALVADGPVVLAADRQGQIVYSTDDGQNWYQGQTDELNRPVTALVTAPDFERTGIALAATDGAGIFMTANRGRMWKPASFGLQDFSVLALAVAPQWGRRQVAFAATTHGVYRSPNGGRAWKPASDGLAGQVIQCVAVSPNFDQDHTVFAGAESGEIFISANGGKSWQPAGPGIAPADGDLPPINALWLHPNFANTRIIVAAAGDGQIFFSPDGGARWHLAANTGAAIFCLHGNGDRLLAGLHRRGLWQSVDGGQSWTEVAGLAAQTVTRLRAISRYLFAFGPTGQMWVSTDAGLNWQPISAPFDGVPLINLEVGEMKTAAPCLLAVTPLGLWRSVDVGQTWQQVSEAQNLLVVHFSPRFTATGRVWAGDSAGRLLASTDGGQRWAQVNAPGRGEPVIALTHGQTDDELVAATYAPDRQIATVWRSADDGATWRQWQQVTTAWPSVQVGRVGAETVVCIDRRGWRQSGVGWERVLDTARPIVRLARLAHDAGLAALTPQQILFSADGLNWSETREGLPKHSLLDIVVAPADNNSQLATVLTAGGTVWQHRF